MWGGVVGVSSGGLIIIMLQFQAMLAFLSEVYFFKAAVNR